MLDRLRRYWTTAHFHLARPFVLTAFHIRQKRQMAKHFPRVWRTSGQLIQDDLEYYEPSENDRFFSRETLDDFTSAVDILNEKIFSGMKINFVIFVFLLAQYLSIKMDLSVFGISIKDAPGVTESLLVFMGLSSFAQVARQRNVYMLDSARKAIIQRIFPEETRSIFLARYLPNEQWGPYFAFNLPHISVTSLPSKLHSTSLFGIILIIFLPAYVVYTGAFAAILINLWSNPSLGWISQAISVYVIVISILSFAYMARYRFYMPMRDYSTNHRIELTEQFHPDAYAEVLNEVFGDSNRERRKLRELGYLREKGE